MSPNMIKIASAITTAAAIAGILTVFFTPSDAVNAGPLAGRAQTTLKSCVARPWPYLNCVGTSLGNPHIRLVTTDRLAP
ncbi:MAG: hypothetical protein GC182_17905 [Rhodopseudomonas sp.]|nr:hypothetical protein [Rhodopseudomonas sp.]